jgi:hypothetical protein
MIKVLRIFRTFVLTTTLLVGTSESLAADVARWSDLQLFEQKFRSIPVKDEIKRAELIEQVADHVTKLVPKQKQKLDGAQVRDLVQILRVIGSADLGNAILENNLILVQTNAKAIIAEVKKLPPKEAAELADSIDTVLSGAVTSDPNYKHVNNKPASGKKQPEVPVKKN